MGNDLFSDAALVLLGHGSTLHAGAAEPVIQHAAALRRRGQFSEVREAFWKQDPQIRSVLTSLTQARVVLCPMFMSEGYFSEQRIPVELGLRPKGDTPWNRRSAQDGRTLFYSYPVGTHPAMTSAILDRARGIVEAFPFPRSPLPGDTTLFIAGHGTGQNQESRRAVEHQTERVRALGIYASVEPVFLEETPGIEDCYRLARTRHLVVVPFFMGEGPHVIEDIPVRLGQPASVVRDRLAAGRPPWRNPTELRGKLVWYSPSVGTDPCLAEVILARVREAVEFNPNVQTDLPAASLVRDR